MLSDFLNTIECKSRYPEDRSLEEDKGYWKVAYLKPRNDKALARECELWDISYYLPLYEKQTRRKANHKPRKSLVPIFAGYFPFADRDGARKKIIESDRIVNFLNILDQEKFVQDITQIQQALQSGAEVEPVVQFEPGQTVIIKDGPMQGILGTIDKAKKNRHIILRVDAFNLYVRVNASETELEIVEVEEAPKQHIITA